MVTKRFSYFCKWTTLHGFPFYHYPNKRRGFHNCFWSLVILSSAIGAFFVVFTNISDFAKSTVSYDLDTPTHSLDDVFFPSLMICNMNRLRGSFIRAIMEELQLTEDSYYDIHNLLQRVFLEGQDSALSKEDIDTIENILNTTFYQSLIAEFYDNRTFLFDATVSNTKVFSFSLATRDRANDTTGRRRLLQVANQFRAGQMFLRTDFVGFGLIASVGDVSTDISESCSWITPLVKKPDKINLLSVKTFARNGINNGLHIIIDAEIYDYDSPMQGKEGFVFALAHQLENPILKQTGKTVMPGQAMQVAITPTLTKTEPSAKLRFKPQDRQCYYEDEILLEHLPSNLYRKDMSNCLYEASVQKIEEECQCAPLILLPTNYPPCEGPGKHCMSKLMEDFGSHKHIVDRGVTKKCLVACQDQTHQYLVTSAAYPNKESFRLGEDYCLVLNKLRRSCENEQMLTLDMKYPDLCKHIKDTSNMTCEAVKYNGTVHNLAQLHLHKTLALYARENLSVLDVYIKDPYVKLYLRREKITVISFIGNIGGLLGLFLGFSFMSIAEMIYVFFLSPDNKITILQGRQGKKDKFNKFHVTNGIMRH